MTQYLRDQVLWLRNHPSILAWMLGSDGLPLPQVEKRYRAELAQIDPTRPALAPPSPGTASERPDRRKMDGPYEYVPPNYWYLDTQTRRGIRI